MQATERKHKHSQTKFAYSLEISLHGADHPCLLPPLIRTLKYRNADAPVGCVGHMFFKCDEMRLNSALTVKTLLVFTEIYFSIHVTARLASNGALNKNNFAVTR